MILRQALVACVLSATCLLELSCADSFGYSTSSSAWTIKTGAGLSVKIQRSNCDITSLLFNGKELQWNVKRSHINSGLGSLSSSIKTFYYNKNSIQVTCSLTGFIQYYFFREGDNIIYMGSYNSIENDMDGNLRFIARLSRKYLPNGPIPSTTVYTTSTVEGSDVFRQDDGQTRSKFYSGIPFYKDYVHGVTGNGVGVYMAISELGYETTSGGPFFRDHDNQNAVANEVYFCMKTSHTQTEPYRNGFFGPYALVFTTGSTPSLNDLDFKFYQYRDLKGFVTTEGRGYVMGWVDDSNHVLDGYETIAGFANEDAQYWATVSNLRFTTPPMKPGTYTMTIYRKELAVATQSVTVTARGVTTPHVSVTYTINSNPIWRIGDWDGTPDGFLNADKIHTMHPSDVRMSNWVPFTYNVNSMQASQFPMALFRGINTPFKIQFTLSSTQAASSRTLRIGVTIAQMGGRPQVTANEKWTSKVPSSIAVKSRGVTRGVTHGYYGVYEYEIPSSALVTGTNIVSMILASGTTDMDGFLKASVVFDALELV